MKRIYALLVVALALVGTANAQFKLVKALGAGAKAIQAATLSDAQLEAYV